jgi:hypothetical protein
MKNVTPVLWLLLVGSAWLLAGVASYLLADVTLGALPIADPDGSGFERHRWTLTIWHGLWPAMAAAAIRAIARTAAHPAGLAWLASGAVIAAALEFTLLGWGGGRFGSQGGDPDLIGPTAFLGALVVLAAVTRFSRELASRPGLRPTRALGMLAALLAALALISNVPGLADGIDADSVPAAAAVGIAGVYCVASALIGWHESALVEEIGPTT